MRIALGIEYDGAAFNGWQTQSDQRSVQDAVESALAQVAGTPIATICAGRTDSGVHALDQVIHFDTDAARPVTAWVRGVNRFLPASIAVQWARPVGTDFHARYGARRRQYDYWILNAPVRSPLVHARAGWVFRALDERAMQRASKHLIGRHDFTSFRSAECQAATPVREVEALKVERNGPLIRISVAANAFLHHMVRNIVGALVYIGVGRQPDTWTRDVLNARDRAAGAPTFSGAGLYLARVEYDPAFCLPAPAAAQPFWIDAYTNQNLRTDARG
ncbi:MAG: tRNA pseudouridine(38-40) synthase TruA [Burkholderiaceae bacterium]